MKFIRKKIIKGRSYYYFEYTLKLSKEKVTIRRYLGNKTPEKIAALVQSIFSEIALRAEEKTHQESKKYFAPKPIHHIEQSRFWYQSFHTDFFQTDLKLFRSLFGILFLLNSNRAEGSKVTRRDLEKVLKRNKKPKTPIEREVINSLAALRFAFSKEMKWNLAAFKKMHLLLFDGLYPEIAGKFKKEDNVVNNEHTTSWKNVGKELGSLLRWFLKNKKKLYPPLCALEFHHKFEAIHPFADGNGRIGRLLFNAFLLQSGYMPAVFFSENHDRYVDAIAQARQGRKKKLAQYLVDQVKKTRTAVLKYKEEGVIRGGSPQVGQWEIERGKIRMY